MRKSAYLKRLKADLDRWSGLGWIDEALSERLLGDASAQDLKSAGVLPGLAAFAVVIGILTIIAANWAALTGVVRLAVLAALLAAALLGAGAFKSRGANTASAALSTIAAALFGGGLVVIGQLYHTGATTSAFLATWTYGAAAVALLFGSPATATFAAALAAAWACAHAGEFGAGFFRGGGYGPWWAIPVWGAMIAVAFRGRYPGPVHFAAIGLMVVLGWPIADLVDQLGLLGADHAVTAALLVAGGWAGFAALSEIGARAGFFALRTFAGWFAWTASALLVVAAAAERFRPQFFAPFDVAIGALFAFAALAVYGSAPGRRWLRGAGVVGFIATSLLFFTYAENLTMAGFILIAIGGAIATLLGVTSKRLAQAKAGAAPGGVA